MRNNMIKLLLLLFYSSNELYISFSGVTPISHQYHQKVPE